MIADPAQNLSPYTTDFPSGDVNIIRFAETKLIASVAGLNATIKAHLHRNHRQGLIGSQGIKNQF